MPRRPTLYYPDYGPDLPTSGPDWVWQRAEFLAVRGRKASRGRDGDDIIRVMNYLRAKEHAFHGRWAKHRRDDPDIYEAVEISGRSHLYLLELHCRVLAKESVGRIAVEMGINRSVLQTYLTVFFNVRERLDRRGYIHQKVVEVTPKHSLNAYQLAMQSAYSHGPEVIPLWMDYLQHVGEVNDLTTVEGRQREALELLVLTHDLEIDAKRAIQLAKWDASKSEIQPKMFRSKSACVIVAENINTWLRGMTFDDFVQGSNALERSRFSGACKELTPGQDRSEKYAAI